MKFVVGHACLPSVSKMQTRTRNKWLLHGGSERLEPQTLQYHSNFKAAKCVQSVRLVDWYVK